MIAIAVAVLAFTAGVSRAADEYPRSL